MGTQLRLGPMRGAVLLPIVASVVVSASTYYFVSTKGNDYTGDGTAAKPWATVFRARDAIRQLKQSHNGQLSYPVEVSVEPGTYFMGQTFALGVEDSGSPGAPVTYSGTGGGVSVLSAGLYVALPSEGARMLSPPSKQAPNGVVNIPLGSSVGCDVTLRQVWGTDGTRRRLTTTDTLQYTSFNGTTIVPKPGTLPAWNNVSRVLASADAIIFHSWTAALVAVQGPDASGNIQLLHTDHDTVFSAALNRYRLQNLVDPQSMAAGDFAHDAAGCSLAYAPLQGETSIVLPLVQTALQVSGNTTSSGAPEYAYNLRFNGLNFTHTTSSVHSCRGSGSCDGQSFASEQESAVMVSVAKNVSFDSVAVCHTGNYAMTLGKGSTGVSVSQSHFFDLGVGGVRIGEPNHGAQPSSSDWEVASGVELADSVIEDGGHVILEGCGVLLEQARDNTVTHNLIRNMLYSGVSVGWDWTYESTSNRNNVVSYNSIYDIMQGELSDGGCVYHLGRSPGTIIDHNVCSGVNSAGYGGWGLYTDQGSSNVTISNNIVHSTKSASFHQHFGTDNLLTNNVFAFPDRWPCSGAHGCDNAAVRSSQHAPGSGLGEHSSFTFERNIVLLFNSTATLFDSTNSIGFKNMTMDSNVYWSLAAEPSKLAFPPTQAPRTFAQWQATGKDLHSVVADPKFVDAQGLDFERLQPDSPALALGFKPIDASSVGPRS